MKGYLKHCSFLFLILILVAWAFSHNSYASCSYQLGTYTLNAGSYTIQRDAPIGTVIGSMSGSSSPLYSNCFTAANYWEIIGLKSALPYNYTDTAISASIFDTSIPGVGIAIGVNLYTDCGDGKTVGNSTKYIGYTTGSWYTNSWLGIVGCKAGISPITYALFSGGPMIRLVKTGPLVNGGGTISGTLGYFTIGATPNVGVNAEVISSQFPITISATITQLACSITTPIVTVPLDPVFTSSFTGVNSTLGAKPFTIGLECDPNARINASLSFTQNTNTTNSSVMQLTGAGAEGVASGVGIQLLYGSTVLNNNSRILLKTSSGGQEFPADAFTARYFQTQSTVTAGDANASATLNLTYQ